MLLVTGSNGQLGTELLALLPEALGVSHRELDITDAAAVQSFIAEHSISTIVNCAAYTAVDKAEDDAQTAYQVNVVGAANLAATGCRMIHISTDYVFDGNARQPYTETDPTNPTSVYGETKRQGEERVLAEAQSALIIRTSWLYSSHGANFLKTMLRLGKEKTGISVVCDQMGTPTFAGDLALAITQILPQWKEQKGIYHFSNEGSASWYDFASEIMKLAGLPCKVSPIETKDYPTRAKRPAFSILDKTKIKRDFSLEIPEWKESLQKCLAQCQAFCSNK